MNQVCCQMRRASSTCAFITTWPSRSTTSPCFPSLLVDARPKVNTFWRPINLDHLRNCTRHQPSLWRLASSASASNCACAAKCVAILLSLPSVVYLWDRNQKSSVVFICAFAATAGLRWEMGHAISSDKHHHHHMPAALSVSS